MGSRFERLIIKATYTTQLYENINKKQLLFGSENRKLQIRFDINLVSRADSLGKSETNTETNKSNRHPMMTNFFVKLVID
jgi:hypothetical protein